MATIEELTEELTDLKAAKRTILTGGQSYGISGRNLTRADLSTIDKMIKETEVRLNMLQSGGITHAVPDLGMSR